MPENTRPEGNNSTGVQSVERVLNIMEVLAECREPLTLGEIARASNLKPSTAHRLVATLVSRGFVCQDVFTGKYRLGLKAFQIGSAALYSLNLRTAALQEMIGLVDRCKETVNLAVMDHTNQGYELIYIEQIESPQMIRMFARIGQPMPLHCTGSGKVLMAFRAERETESIVRSLNLKRFTDKTITDKNKLLQELEEVRNKGYAVDMEETESGIACVAAPIRNHDNQVIAAISVSGPVARMIPSFKSFTLQVLEAARHISQTLGCNI